MNNAKLVLLGDSGVGKSSLINALVGTAAAAVGTLSEASLEGNHTTSASVMHRLADGARLIGRGACDMKSGVAAFVSAMGSAGTIAAAGTGRPSAAARRPALASTATRIKTP